MGWRGGREPQGSGKGAGGNIMGIQRDPLFEGAHFHSLFYLHISSKFYKKLRSI